MDDAPQGAPSADQTESATQPMVVAALGLLLRAPPHALDPAIDAVLERIARATGADRAHLFLRKGAVLSNTHEWCAPGIEPVRNDLQNKPLEALVLDPAALQDGQPMEIGDTLAIPDTPVRRLLRRQGIQSLTVAPLLRDGVVTGLVGMNRVRQPAAFTKRDTALLAAMSDGLMSSLARREAEQEIVRLNGEKIETLERLRATLSAMHDVVLEIDEDGRCIDFHCNRPELLAVSADEILGKTLEETLPADIAQLQRAAMRDAREAGVAEPPVYALGDGADQRWHKLTVAFRASARGSAGYVFGIRDVTKERARDIENTLLSEITRRTTNLVIVLDAEQRIRWVNPAFEARTGWSLDELRGQHPADHSDPASDPTELARIEEAIKNHRECRAEVFKHDRYGNPYWVSVEVKPITASDGTFNGFVVIENDITAYKRHEEALAHMAATARNARHRLRDAIEALPDGFAIFDAEDRLVVCNEKYLELFENQKTAIRPGIRYRDILAVAARSGLIHDARGREEAWIAERLAQHLGAPSEQEIRVGREKWLRVYERRTPDGGRVGLRIDISALKRTEQRLNDIIDGANAGTWEFDLERGETTISGSWAELLGWSTRGALAPIDRETWNSLIHPQDDVVLRKAFNDIRAGRAEKVEKEIRLRADDGRWIHILTRGRVTRHDAQGNPTLISGVGLDVTQRRRAEDRLSAILEASAVGTWQLDGASGATTIDEQYAALLGYTLAGLTPYTIDEFESLVHPEDLPGLRERMSSLRKSDRDRVVHEFRMRHRLGHWVWILSEARVLRWRNDGAPADQSGVHIDITEAKEREAALAEAREATDRALAAHRAAEQRFTDIAHVSNDWFWELDAGMKVAFITPGFERTTGIPAEMLIGRTILDPEDNRFAGPSDDVVEADWTGLEKKIAARESFADFLIRLNLRDDRQPIWLRLSGAPSHDTAGNFTGYRGVGSEVSALVDATERAEAANRAKSYFLANMSHELRTPLTGVLGMAELLGETLQEPRQRDMIDAIRQSGEGLLSILNDILDLAKIEAGKMQIDRAPFTPTALLRQVETLFAPRVRDKGLKFHIRIDPACDALWSGDSTRILQVLNNLVGNAVKFTRGGGITVRAAIEPATDEPARLVLTVEDTGIGMSAEQAAKVFEDFEQAESSTARRFGGTGLGLAITKRLTTLMGGEIMLDTALGRGTSVRVSIPLDPAAAHTAPVADTVSARASIDGLRVLIADDNRTNRRILEAMLRGLGIVVTIAENGHEACDRYEPGAFDLLLLDISMPGLDGIGALNQIRAAEAAAGCAPVPALAVTANAMQHQIDGYMQAGFAGHVAKPFRKATLTQAIAAHCLPPA